MRLRAGHWAIALALSAGAHVAVFVSDKTSQEPSSEASAGTSLAVWGVAANALTQEAEPVEDEAVEPERVEEVTEPEKLAALEEPEALPEALSETSPSVVPAAELEEQRPLEVIEPLEKRVEKPRRKPKKEASLGGPVGQAAGNAGRTKNSTSGTSMANYSSRVQLRLRRFKRRPVGRAAGTVRVVFVLGSNGAVRSLRLARSSGNPALDTAALDIVRRAAPFPPFPSGTGKSSWTFSVPVRFSP